MPDLRFSEVHLPELHLPEMTRDDIVRAISDARRDIDLSRFDPRRTEPATAPRSRVEMPRFDLRRIDLSKVDLSKVDLPKALATAGQAAGLVRPPRRSRMPLLIGGLVTIGLVGFALLSSPMVRPRLGEAARKARARIDAMREAREEEVEELDLDADIVAVPIEPEAFLAPAVDATDTAAAPAEAALASVAQDVDGSVSEATPA